MKFSRYSNNQGQNRQRSRSREGINLGARYNQDQDKSFEKREFNDDFYQDMSDVKWTNHKLSTFQKNFYIENEKVKNRSQSEVKKYRLENDISLQGKHEMPNPILNFNEILLPEEIYGKFKQSGFDAPTAIQSQGWPIALKGHDLIGIAKTGSGKTLGFLLPAFRHIQAQANIQQGDGPICLIVAPTRELACQIQDECVKYGQIIGISSTCVYGGAPRHVQQRELENGKHIIIATPGRLIDFLQSNVTNLRRVTYLVLDEADRMLDMGFEPQIRAICSQIRPDRQTLLWSATWPFDIRELAKDLCKQDPVKLKIGSGELTIPNTISQKILVVSQYEKPKNLERVLSKYKIDDKILIFCNTKRKCDELFQDLQQQGMRAQSIHGDKSQRRRTHVLKDFKSGQISCLVATDVAARGLDVKGIKAVINYDFPQQLNDYVHRIGRTGRAGAKGDSYTFFTQDDARHANDFVRMLKNCKEVNIPKDLMGRNFTSYRKKERNGGRRKFQRGGRGGGRGGNSRPTRNYRDSRGGRDSRRGYNRR